MEPADNMTPEALRSRVLQLEAELEEQEQNVVKAAMFGKSLLEENDDLRSRIDNLMKQHAADLEEKQQEMCSLQSRAEVAVCTQQWQQEEISNVRAELHSVRHNITQKLEEEKRIEVAAYKKQVDSLRLDLDNQQAVEQELRGHVAELEALLQTHLDRTQIHSNSASFTSEEMAHLTEELTTLRMDLTELQAKHIDLTGQQQQTQREKDMLTNRLNSANIEIEDLQCQIMSFSKHLEESRKEVLDLRAQLDASRVENQVHSSKGNSLFSELDDRRMVLEKMMASLKVQNKQLKEKYDIEKQQNQKYKMQIAMALQMSSHKEDPAAKRLRDQLNEAHTEIRTLTDHVQKLESSQGSLASQMTNADLLEKVEDGNYAQYLMAIIKTEKENAGKARAELQTKSLQYLDVTNQNMDLVRQSKQLALERDKLQSQLIRAAIEKEELLLKYEPDKVKSGRLQKRVVEKIEMGEAQFQVREKVVSACAKPSDPFKACTTTGRASDIFKSSATSSRPSDVFRLTTRPSDVLKPVADTEPISKSHGGSQKVNPVKQRSAVIQSAESLSKDESVFYDDKENYGDISLDSEPSFALPVGRKVSMADDVKVIHADGEETVAMLSSEINRPGPSEIMKKKQQPKSTKTVKHVTADEAPQYECKTQ